MTLASPRWLMIAVAVVAFLHVAVDVRAGEDGGKPPVPDEEAATVHAWTSQFITEMACRTDGDQPTKLSPHRESLLQWSVPEVGRVYGNVYIWTADGRPKAIVSLFEWFHPFKGKSAEFHSLSEEPLLAEHRGDVLWKAPAGGARWTKLENVPSPHPNPNLRLTQMRSVARRFSATMVDRRTDKGGVPRTLRLLTTPLYRYDSPAAPAIDGAMFAFVVGSDPDAFLVIEVRDGKEGPEWHYLLTRMNNAEITVYLDDTECRRFEFLQRNQISDPTLPYCLVDVDRFVDAKRKQTPTD